MALPFHSSAVCADDSAAKPTTTKTTYASNARGGKQRPFDIVTARIAFSSRHSRQSKNPFQSRRCGGEYRKRIIESVINEDTRETLAFLHSRPPRTHVRTHVPPTERIYFFGFLFFCRILRTSTPRTQLVSGRLGGIHDK